MAEFLTPSALFVAALFASLVAATIRPSRLSFSALKLSVLVILFIAWSPVPLWLMRPLETRFPTPVLPERVAGIIVLGGAFDVDGSETHSIVELNYRSERMIAFAGLARKYPNALLIFTGGSAELYGKKTAEASIAKSFFSDIGISPSRIEFEMESRNTRENALFTMKLLRDRSEFPWLLVTSAADLPRAVGVFRSVGLSIIPVPVDYHTNPKGSQFPGLQNGLQILDWASHEWIGLVYYRLRGWTPSLFPGP